MSFAQHLYPWYIFGNKGQGEKVKNLLLWVWILLAFGSMAAAYAAGIYFMFSGASAEYLILGFVAGAAGFYIAMAGRGY